MSLWIGYMYVYMTDWLSRERKQILPYILIVEDSKKVSSYVYLKIFILSCWYTRAIWQFRGLN